MKMQTSDDSSVIMMCPNCGAPMKLGAGKDFLACEYCGTTHFPDPNPDGVRVLGVPSEEQCPRCSVALIEASVTAERVLYCQKCHGLLIDMDVFLAVIEELRSHQSSSEYAGKQPEWDDLNQRTKCPKCGVQMDTHPYGGPGNVILDTCEHCSLNWLDYGELQRIVRAPDARYVIAIDEDERLNAQ
jgi:Zn-finger nucleic acid-binding protein